MSHIPDPTQPERVAIRPDGGLAFGVHMGPARADGGPPTPADLDAMVHIGWVDAAKPLDIVWDDAEEPA